MLSILWGPTICSRVCGKYVVMLKCFLHCWTSLGNRLLFRHIFNKFLKLMVFTPRPEWPEGYCYHPCRPSVPVSCPAWETHLWSLDLLHFCRVISSNFEGLRAGVFKSSNDLWPWHFQGQSWSTWPQSPVYACCADHCSPLQRLCVRERPSRQCKPRREILQRGTI